MRNVRRVLLAMVAVTAVAATPAWATQGKSGDYQGCPTSAHVTSGHCEGEGYFTLKGGKIKNFGSFPGVLAPSDFTCNQLNAVLETKSIPVSGGSFDFRGTAKIGYGSSPSGPYPRMNIHFTGQWTSASVVKGFTEISGKTGRGKCDSGKIHWRMKTPPPSSASAQSASATPYVPSGKLTVGAAGPTDPVGVSFSGKFPTLKNGEYVAYHSTSLDGPSGPQQCNPLGIDVGAGPSKPKRKSTTLYPDYGMEWPANEQPRWCAGRWVVQAFIYKPAKHGSYKPRLVFARKNFSIG